MNRLSNSTSPYLLQHAKNPVDWHPWDQAALAKATEEDKPIFLSIGYAACHWCHVMAHESFEDPETAALLNENFISIKVDREERPDIDAIYMRALVALTGAGGWPMSVFLTPQLQPFYAGTYFPPVARHNLPAFKDILRGLVRIWQHDRTEIVRAGGNVAEHLSETMAPLAGIRPWSERDLDDAAAGLQESYDWQNGGWGVAPKFPQPMALEFLIAHLAQQPASKPKLLSLVSNCLRAMTRGGMYDVVGGGFARYSTDAAWHIPHFEKMLYDNALLARVYLHGWQVTGEPDFRRVAVETLDFVIRELTDARGGFYSSLDADSEGKEGVFYSWTLEEIREVVADESDFFETAYGITARGNWDGGTVLQRAFDDASLAARFGLPLETVHAKLRQSHARLLRARARRVRPGTDDKILTAWNGLMLAAFAEAARVLAPGKLHGPYHEVATRNADFLLAELHTDGGLARAWRKGQASPHVFLEDYGALILGLLELYQADFNNRWFSAALSLSTAMISNFRSPAGGFYDTPVHGEVVLFRPQDPQDNATPSGGALACESLQRLDALAHPGGYRELAEAALGTVAEAAIRHPISFSRWLVAAEFALGDVHQVALLGSQDDQTMRGFLDTIRSKYRPNLVLAASAPPSPADAPALLAGRAAVGGAATAYVCRGFVCGLPATSVSGLKKQLAD